MGKHSKNLYLNSKIWNQTETLTRKSAEHPLYRNSRNSIDILVKIWQPQLVNV